MKNKMTMTIRLVILLICLSLQAFASSSDRRPVELLYAEIDVVVGSGVTIPGDSLMLSLYEWGIYEETYHHEANSYKIGGKIVNGICHFRFPMQAPLSYFSLLSPANDDKESGFKLILFNYLIATNDKVTIRILADPEHKIYKRPFTFTFEGRGSDKLSCQRNMFLAAYFTIGNAMIVRNDSLYNADNLFALQGQNELAVLTEWRPKLSPEAFEVLKIDAQADYDYKILNQYRVLLRKTKNTEERSKMLRFYDRIPQSNYPYKEMVKAFSKNFTTWVALRKVVQELLGQPDGKVNYLNIYNALTAEYEGHLAERMLADFLLKYSSVLPKRDSIVSHAINSMETKAYQRSIQPFLNLQSGQTAYPFQLMDIRKQLRGMDELKGKVVFIDFWFTGCSPCRELYESHLKAVKQRFKDNKNVVFVSISIDNDFEAWSKSVATGKYTDLAAVNLYTNGQGRDHPIIQHYGIKGYPTCILVNPEGKVSSPETASMLKNREGITLAIQQLLNRGGQ